MTDHNDTPRTPAAANPFAGMVRQLHAAAQHPEVTVTRFNPKPPGVIQPGSATGAVLAFLQSRPSQFFSRAQLLWHTKRSGKAVDWAMLYLRSQGLVEVISDAARNPRYLRYRLMALTTEGGRDERG